MSESDISVREVTAENWRDVAGLSVTQAQLAFVAEPSYYLALCCYDTWNPLAIYLGEDVIGFLMWGVDDDASCWLGGIIITRKQQGKGYGRRAVKAAVSTLQQQTGAAEFALSYQPENIVARTLYTSVGFRETGETEEEEIVARLRVKG